MCFYPSCFQLSSYCGLTIATIFSLTKRVTGVTIILSNRTMLCWTPVVYIPLFNGAANFRQRTFLNIYEENYCKLKRGLKPYRVPGGVLLRGWTADYTLLNLFRRSFPSILLLFFTIISTVLSKILNLLGYICFVCRPSHATVGERRTPTRKRLVMI